MEANYFAYGVKVLKFRTLFTFFSQIKCWLSGLEFYKCVSEQQTGKTLSLIWVCTVYLGLFSRQLVFKILEHLPYSLFNVRIFYLSRDM